MLQRTILTAALMLVMAGTWVSADTVEYRFEGTFGPTEVFGLDIDVPGVTGHGFELSLTIDSDATPNGLVDPTAAEYLATDFIAAGLTVFSGDGAGDHAIGSVILTDDGHQGIVFRTTGGLFQEIVILWDGLPGLTPDVPVGLTLADLLAPNGHWIGTPGTGTVLIHEASVVSNPVPEPTSLLLLGSGLLAGAGVLRKRFF